MVRMGGAVGLAGALELLDRARGSLLTACRAGTTNDRYIAAHLGALRAGAALLAAGAPRRGRGRATAGARRGGTVRTVWEEVAEIAPELGEWADYLAACGVRRNALEAGNGYATSREADDVLRAAETFLGVVQAALGLPVTSTAPVLAVAGRS